jgi:hypothetical protein
MADELLNGREATDWELAAIGHGRRCEQERDAEVVAGLLTEYPRADTPSARPVTDLGLLP